MRVAEACAPYESSGPLQQCLEAGLRAWLAEPAPILEIRRRPTDLTTSYPVEVLEVRLRDGRVLPVVRKDFGGSRLPKPGRPPEREALVYRELLDGAGLGTPAYLGAVWADGAGPRWLLLEFVDATELKQLGFDDWVKGVVWLGKLHGAFAAQRPRLEACGFLADHDETFFARRAERARRSIAHYSTALGERLERVLAGHDRMAAVLADLPKTLVHGSFRPRNALLARGDGEDRVAVIADRVAVIDWELAARGSGLYDLAFFAQGFRSPQLDVLIDAYRRSAARHGLEVPDSSRTRELLDWFRVHKELKSLGDAHDFAFPEPVVDKILCLAEAVRPGGITS